MSNPILKDIKTVAQVEALEKELNSLKKGFKKAEKQKDIDIIKAKLPLKTKVQFKLNDKILSGIVYTVSLGNSIDIQYTDSKGKLKKISRAIINLPQEQFKK